MLTLALGILLGLVGIILAVVLIAYGAEILHAAMTIFVSCIFIFVFLLLIGLGVYIITVGVQTSNPIAVAFGIVMVFVFARFAWGSIKSIPGEMGKTGP